MSGLDRMVCDYKLAVTKAIADMASQDPKGLHELASTIDHLNKAWDDLTDHLVRQREARDETIAHLHNVVATLKRPR